MLRVGFESNCEYGIPGCGLHLRERVVALCPELMVRDSWSEGDAGMCNFREYEVFSFFWLNISLDISKIFCSIWSNKNEERIRSAVILSNLAYKVTGLIFTTSIFRDIQRTLHFFEFFFN
jgi:hypothetical protein